MEKTVDPDGYIKTAILKPFRGSTQVRETVIPNNSTEEWSNEHHATAQYIVDKETRTYRRKEPLEDVNWFFWREKRSEKMEEYIYLKRVSVAEAEEEFESEEGFFTLLREHIPAFWGFDFV